MLYNLWTDRGFDGHATTIGNTLWVFKQSLVFTASLWALSSANLSQHHPLNAKTHTVPLVAWHIWPLDSVPDVLVPATGV